MNRDVVRDRHRCLIGGEWGVEAGWGGTFDGKEERGGGWGGGCEHGSYFSCDEGEYEDTGKGLPPVRTKWCSVS